MADLASVATVLTGIKTATEIAKTLKDIDVSIERAELKLQMAELISALADTKISAAEIQELVLEKDKEIQDLKNMLMLKDKVIRFGDAYYSLNNSGKATGSPYCSHCWESESKLIHLHSKGVQRICASCDTIYQARNTPNNPDKIMAQRKKDA